MMKAHGINPNGGPASPSPPASSSPAKPTKGGGGGDTATTTTSAKDGTEPSNSKKTKTGKQAGSSKRKAGTTTATGIEKKNNSSDSNTSKRAKVLESSEKIVRNHAATATVKEESVDSRGATPAAAYENNHNDNYAGQNQNQNHLIAVARDPLLSEATTVGLHEHRNDADEDAALFNEFCNTGGNGRSGGDGEQFEVVAPSSSLEKDEEDVEDDVTVKAEPISGLE